MDLNLSTVLKPQAIQAISTTDFAALILIDYYFLVTADSTEETINQVLLLLLNYLDVVPLYFAILTVLVSKHGLPSFFKKSKRTRCRSIHVYKNQSSLYIIIQINRLKTWKL